MQGRCGKAHAPSGAAAVQRRRPVALALGHGLEFDAIGVVDNAIEDRVRDRGLCDYLWSAIHGDLADAVRLRLLEEVASAARQSG